MADALRSIVGRRLTSAEQVHDYIQFRFEDEYLSAYTPIVLILPDLQATFPDALFMEELSKRVGHLIANTEFIKQERISIELDDGARIDVSLQTRDYNGPEAAEFRDPTGILWVV